MSTEEDKARLAAIREEINRAGSLFRVNDDVVWLIQSLEAAWAEIASLEDSLHHARGYMMLQDNRIADYEQALDEISGHKPDTWAGETAREVRAKHGAK